MAGGAVVVAALRSALAQRALTRAAQAAGSVGCSRVCLSAVFSAWLTTEPWALPEPLPVKALSRPPLPVAGCRPRTGSARRPSGRRGRGRRTERCGGDRGCEGRRAWVRLGRSGAVVEVRSSSASGARLASRRSTILSITILARKRTTSGAVSRRGGDRICPRHGRRDHGDDDRSVAPVAGQGGAVDSRRAAGRAGPAASGRPGRSPPWSGPRTSSRGLAWTRALKFWQLYPWRNFTAGGITTK